MTDTFHGVIFSVINRRKFAAIIRPSNRNKLSCLLEELGLARRSVKDMKQLGDILDSPVDFRAVEDILNRERSRARDYLKEQLINEQGVHQSGS